jgi:hypothetical protein
MQQINLIDFIDMESRQEGIAIVRAGEGEIGLTLSLKEDGDVEVFLGIRECEQLLSSIQKAVSIAKGAVLIASV